MKSLLAVVGYDRFKRLIINSPYKIKEVICIDYEGPTRLLLGYYVRTKLNH